MTNKLSVIVPVFNTEQYLRKCIESICEQTYKNLEIICIDDGSCDSSGLILDELERKDSRLKVYHQKNHGESYARNRGLLTATGEYIAFVDCDDWVEADMYETLISALEDKQVDISAGSWFREYDNKSEVIFNEVPIHEQVFNQKKYLQYLYMRDSYRGFAYMWNKVFRQAIMMQSGLPVLFDETLKIGGDVLFLAETAIASRKVSYIERPFYHYRQRRQSGSRTDDLDKLYDWVMAYEKVIDLFLKQNISDEIVNYVKRFIAYHCGNFTEVAVRQNDIEMKEQFQQIMAQYEREYMKLNRQYQDRIEWFKRIVQI
ncbi:MAG: glycosyltransferase [Selenomonadaceae bacterium]|nr:glycosyltransferase [Selenomonadaceae bacterium]